MAVALKVTAYGESILMDAHELSSNYGVERENAHDLHVSCTATPTRARM